MGGGKHGPPEERFWRKVVKLEGEDACWEWIGYIQTGKPGQGAGYGRFNIGKENRWGWAHNYAYRIQHGPLGPGECALHRCDNRPCVRGSHLFKGTRADNTADMVAKDRQFKGEKASETRRAVWAKKKGVALIPRSEWQARGSRKYPAPCHPERPHAAKGLCMPCYQRQRRANRKALVPA